MKFLLFLWIILTAYLHAELKFIGENLTFVLKEKRFSVSGTYFFKNSGSSMIKTRLHYPFMADSAKYEAADSVYVYNQQNGNKEILRRSQDCIYFPVECPPDSTVQYLIGYSQNLKKDEAEYILTTTGNWNAPLLFADYNLVADTSLVIDSFSYEPDRSFKSSDKHCFVWHMDYFMPPHNMLFKFHKK